MAKGKQIRSVDECRDGMRVECSDGDFGRIYKDGAGIFNIKWDSDDLGDEAMDSLFKFLEFYEYADGQSEVKPRKTISKQQVYEMIRKGMRQGWRLKSNDDKPDEDRVTNIIETIFNEVIENESN